MKTKAEWGQDILDITMNIQQNYPELSKYIDEMPVNGAGSNTTEVSMNSLEQYYISLEDLLVSYSKVHKSKESKFESKKLTLLGYPHYLPMEDIYERGKQEQALNPENLSKNKSANELVGVTNEKDFEQDMSGDDLDVPGSELDDQQESIGNEDEENNYYSIGGDRHNDLEEDGG